jgi:hypothetical protein
MKKNKGLRPTAFLVAAVLAGFTACQQDNSSLSGGSPGDNALKAAAQTYTAETFDEVMEIGDETLSLYEGLLRERNSTGNDSIRHHHDGFLRDLLENILHRGDSVRLGDLDPAHGHSRMGPCTRISKDYAGDTLVTTINFGTDSCAGFDGKARKGKIIMTCIGDYWNGEAKVNFSFSDYSVDGNQVTGSTEVSSSINEEGKREALIKEEGSIVMGDGSGTITLSSEKTRVVTEGSDTPTRKDDVVEVTGSATGTLLSGNTFASTTLSPLVRSYSKGCTGVFVSGVTNISISDGTEITLDYGDGTCDKVALLTTNGVTDTLELDSFLKGPPRDSTATGFGHHGGRRHRHGF